MANNEKPATLRVIEEVPAGVCLAMRLFLGVQ